MAHVTDIDACPARLLRRLSAELFDHIDHFGMRPVAVARQAHGLPCWSRLRQLLGPGKAAFGIAAIGCRRLRRGETLGPEKAFGLDAAQRAARRADGRQGDFLTADVSLSSVAPAGGERKGQRHGGEGAKQRHVAKSPLGLTHANRINPMMKSPTTGVMPSR